MEDSYEDCVRNNENNIFVVVRNGVVEDVLTLDKNLIGIKANIIDYDVDKGSFYSCDVYHDRGPGEECVGTADIITFDVDYYEALSRIVNRPSVLFKANDD